MISIESASNGFVLNVGYPESVPPMVVVCKTFPEVVNEMAFFFLERKIGEEITLKFSKDEEL